MKAIIHPGFHKTGTTSIQRYFAENRNSLVNSGIYYPNFAKIAEQSNKEIGHFRFAEDVATDSESLQLYSDFLASDRPPSTTTFISAESMIRHRAPGFKDRRSAKIAYAKRISGIFADSIQVIFTIRKSSEFADGCYRELIKKTRYSKTFENYIVNEFLHLDYFENIEVWKTVTDDVKILPYELMCTPGNDLVSSFVKTVFGIQPSQRTDIKANPSASPVVTEFKRLLNMSTLDDSIVNRLFFKAINTGYQHISNSCSYWNREKMNMFLEGRLELFENFRDMFVPGGDAFECFSKSVTPRFLGTLEIDRGLWTDIAVASGASKEEVAEIEATATTFKPQTVSMIKK